MEQHPSHYGDDKVREQIPAHYGDDHKKVANNNHGVGDTKIGISGEPDKKTGTSGEADKKTGTSGGPDKKTGTSGEPDKKTGISGEPDKKTGASGGPDTKTGISGEADKKTGISGESDKKTGISGEADKKTGTSGEADKKTGARGGPDKTKIPVTLELPLKVEIAGSWSDNWDPIPCQKGKTGAYVVAMNLVPGKYYYKYRINGAWYTDPAKPSVQDPIRGFNNVLEVESPQKLETKSTDMKTITPKLLKKLMEDVKPTKKEDKTTDIVLNKEGKPEGKTDKVGDLVHKMKEKRNVWMSSTDKVLGEMLEEIDKLTSLTKKFNDKVKNKEKEKKKGTSCLGGMDSTEDILDTFTKEKDVEKTLSPKSKQKKIFTAKTPRHSPKKITVTTDQKGKTVADTSWDLEDLKQDSFEAVMEGDCIRRITETSNFEQYSSMVAHRCFKSDESNQAPPIDTVSMTSHTLREHQQDKRTYSTKGYLKKELPLIALVAQQIINTLLDQDSKKEHKSISKKTTQEEAGKAFHTEEIEIQNIIEDKSDKILHLTSDQNKIENRFKTSMISHQLEDSPPNISQDWVSSKYQKINNLNPTIKENNYISMVAHRIPSNKILMSHKSNSLTMVAHTAMTEMTKDAKISSSFATHQLLGVPVNVYHIDYSSQVAHQPRVKPFQNTDLISMRSHKQNQCFYGTENSEIKSESFKNSNNQRSSVFQPPPEKYQSRIVNQDKIDTIEDSMEEEPCFLTMIAHQLRLRLPLVHQIPDLNSFVAHRVTHGQFHEKILEKTDNPSMTSHRVPMYKKIYLSQIEGNKSFLSHQVSGIHQNSESLIFSPGHVSSLPLEYTCETTPRDTHQLWSTKVISTDNTSGVTQTHSTQSSSNVMYSGTNEILKAEKDLGPEINLVNTEKSKDSKLAKKEYLFWKKETNSLADYTLQKLPIKKDTLTIFGLVEESEESGYKAKYDINELEPELSSTINETYLTTMTSHMIKASNTQHNLDVSSCKYCYTKYYETSMTAHKLSNCATIEGENVNVTIVQEKEEKVCKTQPENNLGPEVQPVNLVSSEENVPKQKRYLFRRREATYLNYYTSHKLPIEKDKEILIGMVLKSEGSDLKRNRCDRIELIEESIAVPQSNSKKLTTAEVIHASVQKLLGQSEIESKKVTEKSDKKENDEEKGIIISSMITHQVFHLSKKVSSDLITLISHKIISPTRYQNDLTTITSHMIKPANRPAYNPQVSSTSPCIQDYCIKPDGKKLSKCATHKVEKMENPRVPEKKKEINKLWADNGLGPELQFMNLKSSEENSLNEKIYLFEKKETKSIITNFISQKLPIAKDRTIISGLDHVAHERQFKVKENVTIDLEAKLLSQTPPKINPFTKMIPIPKYEAIIIGMVPESQEMAFEPFEMLTTTHYHLGKLQNELKKEEPTEMKVENEKNDVKNLQKNEKNFNFLTSLISHQLLNIPKQSSDDFLTLVSHKITSPPLIPNDLTTMVSHFLNTQNMTEVSSTSDCLKDCCTSLYDTLMAARKLRYSIHLDTQHQIKIEDIQEEFPVYNSNLMESEILIAGDWSQTWATKPCQVDNFGNIFVNLTLPLGVYQYKFLHNGIWYIDSSRPTVKNSYGTLNNILEISDSGNSERTRHTLELNLQWKKPSYQGWAVEFNDWIMEISASSVEIENIVENNVIGPQLSSFIRDNEHYQENYIEDIFFTKPEMTNEILAEENVSEVRVSDGLFEENCYMYNTNLGPEIVPYYFNNAKDNNTAENYFYYKNKVESTFNNNCQNNVPLKEDTINITGLGSLLDKSGKSTFINENEVVFGKVFVDPKATTEISTQHKGSDVFSKIIEEDNNNSDKKEVNVKLGNLYLENESKLKGQKLGVWKERYAIWEQTYSQTLAHAEVVEEEARKGKLVEESFKFFTSLVSHVLFSLPHKGYSDLISLVAHKAKHIHVNQNDLPSMSHYSTKTTNIIDNSKISSLLDKQNKVILGPEIELGNNSKLEEINIFSKHSLYCQKETKYFSGTDTAKLPIQNHQIVIFGLFTEPDFKNSGLSTEHETEMIPEDEKSDYRSLDTHRANYSPMNQIDLPSFNIKSIDIIDNYEISSLSHKLLEHSEYETTIKNKITDINDNYIKNVSAEAIQDTDLFDKQNKLILGPEIKLGNISKSEEINLHSKRSLYCQKETNYFSAPDTHKHPIQSNETVISGLIDESVFLKTELFIHKTETTQKDKASLELKVNKKDTSLTEISLKPENIDKLGTELMTIKDLQDNGRQTIDETYFYDDNTETCLGPEIKQAICDYHENLLKENYLYFCKENDSSYGGTKKRIPIEMGSTLIIGLESKVDCDFNIHNNLINEQVPKIRPIKPKSFTQDEMVELIPPKIKTKKYEGIAEYLKETETKKDIFMDWKIVTERHIDIDLNIDIESIQSRLKEITNEQPYEEKIHELKTIIDAQDLDNLFEMENIEESDNIIDDQDRYNKLGVVTNTCSNKLEGGLINMDLTEEYVDTCDEEDTTKIASIVEAELIVKFSNQNEVAMMQTPTLEIIAESIKDSEVFFEPKFIKDCVMEQKVIPEFINEPEQIDEEYDNRNRFQKRRSKKGKIIFRMDLIKPLLDTECIRKLLDSKLEGKIKRNTKEVSKVIIGNFIRNPTSLELLRNGIDEWKKDAIKATIDGECIRILMDNMFVNREKPIYEMSFKAALHENKKNFPKKELLEKFSVTYEVNTKPAGKSEILHIPIESPYTSGIFKKEEENVNISVGVKYIQNNNILPSEKKQKEIADLGSFTKLVTELEQSNMSRGKKEEMSNVTKNVTESKIMIAGSWSESWATTPCQIDEYGNLSVELKLLCGIYHYKFFINGLWYVDTSRPYTANSFGTLNNILEVTRSVKDNEGPVDIEMKWKTPDYIGWSDDFMDWVIQVQDSQVVIKNQSLSQETLSKKSYGKNTFEQSSINEVVIGLNDGGNIKVSEYLDYKETDSFKSKNKVSYIFPIVDTSKEEEIKINLGPEITLDFIQFEINITKPVNYFTYGQEQPLINKHKHHKSTEYPITLNIIGFSNEVIDISSNHAAVETAENIKEILNENCIKEEKKDTIGLKTEGTKISFGLRGKIHWGSSSKLNDNIKKQPKVHTMHMAPKKFFLKKDQVLKKNYTPKIVTNNYGESKFTISLENNEKVTIKPENLSSSQEIEVNLGPEITEDFCQYDCNITKPRMYSSFVKEQYPTPYTEYYNSTERLGSFDIVGLSNKLNHMYSENFLSETNNDVGKMVDNFINDIEEIQENPKQYTLIETVIRPVLDITCVQRSLEVKFCGRISWKQLVLIKKNDKRKVKVEEKQFRRDAIKPILDSECIRNLMDSKLESNQQRYYKKVSQETIRNRKRLDELRRKEEQWKEDAINPVINGECIRIAMDYKFNEKGKAIPGRSLLKEELARKKSTVILGKKTELKWKKDMTQALLDCDCIRVFMDTKFYQFEISPEACVAATKLIEFTRNDFIKEDFITSRDKVETNLITSDTSTTTVPSNITIEPSVMIAGTWSVSWATTPCLIDKYGNWRVKLTLPCGVYQYKFCINDQWYVDSTMPYTINSFGTLNNILEVNGDSDNKEEQVVLQMKWNKPSYMGWSDDIMDWTIVVPDQQIRIISMDKVKDVKCPKIPVKETSSCQAIKKEIQQSEYWNSHPEKTFTIKSPNTNFVENFGPEIFYEDYSCLSEKVSTPKMLFYQDKEKRLINTCFKKSFLIESKIIVTGICNHFDNINLNSFSIDSQENKEMLLNDKSRLCEGDFNFESIASHEKAETESQLDDSLADIAQLQEVLNEALKEIQNLSKVKPNIENIFSNIITDLDYEEIEIKHTDIKPEHSLLELTETMKEIPDVSFDPLMEAIERALSLTKAQEILAEDIERGLSVSHELPQLVPSSGREEIISLTVNLPWIIEIAGSWSHWKPQLCQIDGFGGWTVELHLSPGIYEYKYFINQVSFIDKTRPTKIYPTGEITNILQVTNPSDEQGDKIVRQQHPWKVEVVGDWSDQPTMCQMVDSSCWSAGLNLAPGVYKYKYRINGSWYTDPSKPTIMEQHGDLSNVLEV